MNKKVAKKIITIGGGSGQSQLLHALKDYPFDITAVVSMVDDGGSTGQLREQLGVLPAGDVRRCLVALAQANPELQQLMEYRFTKGDLTNHALGNIMLAGLEQSHQNFITGVQIVSDWLKVQGTVLPVTLTPATLLAELVEGTVIIGETNIDVPKHDANLAIKKIYLEPEVQAYPPVLEAIQQADLIVLTIGDLYTSVLPNLLVNGVAEAIQRSKAKVVYTCNATNKAGETHNFTAQDYVSTLEQYLQRKLDYVILNSNFNIQATLEAVQYDSSKNYIVADLLASNGSTIDSVKLAEQIFQLSQKL